MTQEVVARRAGVTAKFLSQIENGHSNPSIAAVMSIVESGLGLTLSEFFAEDAASKDDLTKIRALLAGQPPAARRRALRVIKALLDE